MKASMMNRKPIGLWHGDHTPKAGDDEINKAIFDVNKPVFLLGKNGQIAVSQTGAIFFGKNGGPESGGYPLVAYAPKLGPEDLGEAVFKEKYNIKYPYICGEMANGITSVKMVEEAGKAGMLGFFGAGGLSLDKIEKAIRELNEINIPYGSNLIHNPNDPEQESATVNLYLSLKVRLISASAYLNLTPSVVYLRVKGIHEDDKGNIVCPNKIIAKVSRIEIAQKFLSPPPEKLIYHLLDQKLITHKEADLAKNIPMADDITAEADSGGHTDNRPAISLLPTIIALRDEMVEKFNYNFEPSVGLGGGIGTPYSAAAAFAMGAAYILTGSINQPCREAATSETVKTLLVQAKQADVAMAPAADMFELGAKVQVLKRGTMFAFRASKLYDLYNKYEKYEDMPNEQRLILERDFFKNSFEDEWEQTKSYFYKTDPKQITRGEKDAKHKMALVFRSYLGRSSMWAISGDPSRIMDYQIWCGPSIGAFNQWVKGSFLENLENRKTVTIAMNLLLGAAIITRTNWIKNQGVLLSPRVGKYLPLSLYEINDIIQKH